MYALLGNLFEVSVNDLLANIFDRTVLDACFKINILCAVKHRNAVDIFKHDLSCAKCKLTAVRTVNLIAVVLCRVMARCNNDTCTALKLSYCEGEHWCRHKLRININLDAVS